MSVDSAPCKAPPSPGQAAPLHRPLLPARPSRHDGGVRASRFQMCALLSAALLGSGLGCGDETVDAPAVVTKPEIEPDWAPMTVPTPAPLLGIWGRSATEIYAVGWDGTALRYDGLTWTLETTTATVPLVDVSGAPLDPEDPLSPTRVLAVGWSGTLLERGADGVWVDAPRTATTGRDLAALHVVDAETALTVGDAGTILEWDGAAWAPVTFEIESELSGALVEPRTALAGVWSANGQRWMISAAGGQTYRSAGGTSSFAAVDSRESLPFRGVWGTSNGSVYTVGLEGVVLRYTNRWRRESAGLPDQFLFGVWGRSESDLTVVGWGGTIARRLDGEWMREDSGSEVDLRDVWVDAETGAAFAVGARGTILTRTSTAGLDPL